jgi:hypothetical protein
MTRNEMLKASEACISDLAGLVEEMQNWEYTPRYDEDYKVEREPRFNQAFFDELKVLTAAVARHCAQKDSPFE